MNTLIASQISQRHWLASRSGVSTAR